MALDIGDPQLIRAVATEAASPLLFPIDEVRRPAAAPAVEGEESGRWVRRLREVQRHCGNYFAYRIN